MNTDYLVNELTKRKQFLSSIISSKSAISEDTYPAGRLRCDMHKGNPQYYLITQKNDSLGKYIPKSNQELACKLAQKEYDRRILALAQSEYTAVCNLLKKYSKINVDTLYDSLHSMRRELITPIQLPDSQFLEKWMNIPYHFEFPLKTRRLGIIHPDFSVLNLRTRKVYFWEHCGRMDDPKYVNKWITRNNVYAEEGIYPGERLLQTFETSTTPIDTRDVEAIIRHYLL